MPMATMPKMRIIERAGSEGHGSPSTATPISTPISIETSVAYAQMRTTRPYEKPRLRKTGCVDVEKMPATTKQPASGRSTRST